MITITPAHIKINEQYVSMKLDEPLKVVSSAIHQPGVGMYRQFINRTVDYTYNPADPREEMAQFLQREGFDLEQTVGMMTAVLAEQAKIQHYDYEGTSIVIMVTAGVGNAVDITRAFNREDKIHAGTINTWIIVNGELSDEAFFQAMIAATEAKTKALFDEQVTDPTTGTLATGTSTDSVMIAATQQGFYHQYAGSITPLGTLIGYGVYETMRVAIQEYKRYKEEQGL